MSTQTHLGNDLIREQNAAAAPGFALSEMATFWNWELVYTCNYRCTYCNYTANGWDKHYHMNAYPGLARLTEVWRRLHTLYGSCHIELSGGECSSYPGFYELMGMLTRWHTITMDTNLSFDAERFASSLDVRRIRMSASFHPQYATFEAFLARCLALRDKGIDQIFVNYVAYPDQLARMGEYKREFKRHGISCFVQPFQGVYRKQAVYPDSYTPEERALIDEALSDGGADTKISLIRFAWQGSTMRSGTENQLRQIEAERVKRGEAPLVEGQKEKALRWSPFPWDGLAPKPPEGAPEPARRQPVLCRMGQKYAKTYANGDTFRCCAQLREDMPWRLFKEKVYLGNLFFDDDLRLLAEPAPCDYEPCPCDRCMVVGQEGRWAERWYAPKVAEPAGAAR